MASMGTEEFRKLLADRLEKFIKRTPDREQYPVPPPQIIEAMVDVETGGTFDPDFVDPNSGAIGLGNITVDGLEWGVYKANHPDAKESDLTDPAVNLDVMIEGMSYRAHLGKKEGEIGSLGLYEDWYLAAGGYLGGLTNDGEERGPDAYGTTWRDYVRRVRGYITRVWSAETARDVDIITPKAAVAAGGDWGEGAISYDVDAVAADDRQERYTKLVMTYGTGIDIGGLISGITDPLKDVAGQVISGILSGLAAIAPRVGLAVAGLALAVVGIAVLFRKDIVGLVPAGRAIQAAKGASGG